MLTPSRSPVGTVSVKVLPWPHMLWTVNSPPSNSAMWREMASPRPVPPNFREIEASPWWNGWNSCGSASWRMPIPVSMTSIWTAGRPLRQAGRSETTIRTLPFSVNLTALPARFTIACRSRAPSVSDRLRQLSGVLDRERDCRAARRAAASCWPRRPTSTRGCTGCMSNDELAGLDLRQIEDVVDQIQAGARRCGG